MLKRVMLLISLFFIFGCLPVLAEDRVVENAVVQNDLKQIFREVNEKARGFKNWRELFPGWSEDEVINFFQDAQLIATNYEQTQKGIAKYGPRYEVNPIVHGLAESGVNAGSLLIPTTAAMYFLVKDMSPTERRVTLLSIGVMEFLTLERHRIHGFKPQNLGRVRTITILRIKF